MKNKRVLLAAAAYNLAESHRMAQIGESLKRFGMEVFTLGEGRYDMLLKESGTHLTLPEDEMWYTDNRIDKLMNMDKYGNDYCTYEELWCIVKAERELLEKVKPLFVITGYRTTLSISCKSMGIPLVWVLSATISKPYFERGLAEMPWRYPVEYVKNIQDAGKQMQYYSRLALKNAGTSKIWIQLQKELGMKPFHSDLDVYSGDFNLMSDARELFPQLQDLPETYRFCGPLFMHKKIDMPRCIKNYVDMGKRKIFVSMGSSGEKNILLKVLRGLCGFGADVFVAATSILSEEDIAEFEEGFFFAESFPHREIAEWVDISVIHGGQGTVYTSLLSGKPFIGIPMFSEQQYNLGNLEKIGNMVRMKEEDITRENLQAQIQKMFDEPSWQKNAIRIRKQILPYYEENSLHGADSAAEIILKYGEKAGW